MVRCHVKISVYLRFLSTAVSYLYLCTWHELFSTATPCAMSVVYRARTLSLGLVPLGGLPLNLSLALSQFSILSTSLFSLSLSALCGPMRTSPASGGSPSPLPFLSTPSAPRASPSHYPPPKGKFLFAGKAVFGSFSFRSWTCSVRVTLAPCTRRRVCGFPSHTRRFVLPDHAPGLALLRWHLSVGLGYGRYDGGFIRGATPFAWCFG